jgi:hypothetical protein
LALERGALLYVANSDTEVLRMLMAVWEEFALSQSHSFTGVFGALSSQIKLLSKLGV